MTLLTVHQDNHPTPTPATPGPATTPPPHPTPMPRLTTTVPREYVHRSSLAEVFLTGSEKTGDNHYTLTAQWPRAHTFYTTPDGTHHDPLQAAETIRQTGLYLAHAELGVPLDHHFLMWNIHLTTHPQHLHIGPTPTDLTLTATCTTLRYKGKRLADFTMHIHITRNGHTTATGGGQFTCLTPTTYQRLRQPHTTHPTPQPPTPHTPPTDPTPYGRTLPLDLVLTPTPTPHTWQLTPNPHHPILFDHTTDHIPGMVLLEAARQATHTHTHPTPTHLTTLHATFHRYTEHHTPTYITTHTHPNTNTNVDDNTDTNTTNTNDNSNHADNNNIDDNGNGNGNATHNEDSTNTTPGTRTTHITAHQNNTTVFTAHITTTPTHHP
ncbi:ScbA/BarX family gamma-butyrolactone biosynthesis protein [Streptomyces sp. NPDC048448]|uniref:ScbA/BarX family gamma-butyrolactone biosynthesis protein n=1 Tax=Streptomyces sp. NPDC048448 TaxID=3365554 RepID=UPI003719DC7D